MITIEATASGKFAVWSRKLKGLPKDVTRATMSDLRQILLYEARKNASKGHAKGGLNRRSGNLYRKLRTRMNVTPKGADLKLTGPFYGRANARGAVITPKNAPYLVFKVGTRWVRTKRVVIPSRPWDVAALKTTKGQFPATFRKQLKKYVDGAA